MEYQRASCDGTRKRTRRGFGRLHYILGIRQGDSQRSSGQRVPAKRLNYYPETDSLYIDLSERPGVESREISQGVVLDYNSRGNLAAIDIDNGQ